MKTLHMVAITLVFVGALNWGLIGLFGFNLVTMLFGSWMGVENLVYILVGLSAVLEIMTHGKNCKMCKMK